MPGRLGRLSDDVFALALACESRGARTLSLVQLVIREMSSPRLC